MKQSGSSCSVAFGIYKYNSAARSFPFKERINLQLVLNLRSLFTVTKSFNPPGGRGAAFLFFTILPIV